MRKIILFTFALVFVLTCILAGGIVFLRTRTNGFSARAEPTAVEVFAAQTARSIALPSGARERINPVANSQAVLDEAMAHWADHCAVCHGNDGSGQVAMGRQMYPHAPDMRKEGTQKLTDGELFYIIENGIRLSGMPAWGGSKGSEDASWRVVRFIRHLPDLSAEEIARMEKLNPMSPDEREREQAEEQFLNGQTPAETPKQHHH